MNPGQTINILLVDDHPLVRDGLRARLETVAHIHISGEAGNAHDALKIASEQQTDLVLMDIRLPDANGLELTKEIKAIRPGLPVIAQTAYALTSDRNKSEEFGCDGYISKPISKSELFRIIDETMRNFYPVNNMH